MQVYSDLRLFSLMERWGKGHDFRIQSDVVMLEENVCETKGNEYAVFKGCFCL